MSFRRIPLDRFAETFSTTVELSSVALGGRVTAVSDEFFAEALNLLKVEAAPSLKGQFGPKGALYSGWESRRHNPTYDWCIIKLGSSGSVLGFDVDTAHFDGNEAPEISIDALFSTGADEPRASDSRWFQVLPRVDIGPNSRHLFEISRTAMPVNYVKLNMYPDGGIARFRVYGLVAPIFPSDTSEPLDLAYVFAGGRTVFVSDQHFGVGSNLLLPGRGSDMGDGWETRRSRQKGHKDFVIIKLGDTGFLSAVEIDTAHFMGNYPESCELHAVYSDQIIPHVQDDSWVLVLPRTKLGPHRKHHFQLINTQEDPFTHVRVTIFPDGGIKRVRVIGTRIPAVAGQLQEFRQHSDVGDIASVRIPATDPRALPTRKKPSIPALPLTSEAFSPFGQVVMAWANINAVPRGIRVTTANQGSATKFHKLAPVQSSYPDGSGANPGLSVFRCGPASTTIGGDWEVRLLERHPYTNQAFIPMGTVPGLGDDSLPAAGRAYLVIVAQNGQDDNPDLDTLRAFIANVGQGIVYNTGIWHHPMIALETTIDFTCVESQIGKGDREDCEIFEVDESMELPTSHLLAPTVVFVTHLRWVYPPRFPTYTLLITSHMIYFLRKHSDA